MKLLLDQNLSYRMLDAIDSAFPGSSHVRLHGFEAATDTEIWNFAKNRDFVIVTRDVDFFERSLILGAPPVRHPSPSDRRSNDAPSAAHTTTSLSSGAMVR